MMLDILIYQIGFAVLLLSIWRRHAFTAAALLCFSFVINELTYIAHPTWAELEHRYMAIAVKDALIMTLLYTRLKTPEFMLGLSFAVSGLFHGVMLIEIENQILTLKHARTDFMVILTAVQLAIVIFILLTGNTSHGGKRAKYRFYTLRGVVHRIPYSAAYKVTK